MHVKTDIGRKFLNILDSSFPQSNPLRKIFHRSSVKIAYRTSPNLQQIIAKHNNKILRQGLKIKERMCNCRIGRICPLNGKCLLKNIIYQAIVKVDNEIHTYIGLTSTTFKDRLYNHTQSFKNEKLKNSCKLAQFIWNLKNNGKNYEVTWKLINRAHPYSVASNICSLCILEKYYILYFPNMSTINERSELVNNCRHKSAKLLDKG